MDLKDDKGTIDIIKDAEGKCLVLVNDIRFKGRRGINWKEVEGYLKEYVGNCYEILETSEKVYIGRDFPNEFAHSEDTKRLKGMNAKAKANSSQAIGELLQIATNRVHTQDYNNKHGKKAEKGWYRYDTRFALPVYDENGVLEKYNIFSARLLVRCADDDCLYLYDVLRTKKEASTPLGQ